MSAWTDAFDRFSQVERIFNQHTDPLGISPATMHLLVALYAKDGQRVVDLATALKRVQTSFTPIVDAAERAGLVRRVANASDRRSVCIFLTERGKELRGPVLKALHAAEAEANVIEFAF